MTHKSAIYFEYTDGREVNGCTIQVNLFRGIIVLFDQQASTAANHLHFVLVGAAAATTTTTFFSSTTVAER